LVDSFLSTAGGAGWLSLWPTPDLELPELVEPALELLLGVVEDPGFAAVSGVVSVGVLAAPLAAGADTLITWAGVAPVLVEALERPIKTPMPIASRSTPTPARTVTALLRPGPPAVGGTYPGGDAGGAVVPARAWEKPPAPDGGPPSRTLLIGARRSPHSRQ